MTPYVILIITGLSFLINFLASYYLSNIVKNTRSASMSGDEVANTILNLNHISNVKVRKIDIAGENDYDPILKVIQLSPDVYGCKTIYSIAVGSHEACHAVDFQYYRFLFIPVTFFVKYIFIPLFLLSFFIDSNLFHGIVLLVYLSLLLLKLIVEVVDEFHINRMSVHTLKHFQLVSPDEVTETKKLYRFFNFSYLVSLPLMILFNR